MTVKSCRLVRALQTDPSGFGCRLRIKRAWDLCRFAGKTLDSWAIVWLATSCHSPACSEVCSSVLVWLISRIWYIQRRCARVYCFRRRVGAKLRVGGFSGGPYSMALLGYRDVFQAQEASPATLSGNISFSASGNTCKRVGLERAPPFSWQVDGIVAPSC